MTPTANIERRTQGPQDISNARRHWEILSVALFVIVAAFALRVRGDRVALWCLPDYPVPQVCAARIWFGVNCPACGLTRSIVYLAHGQWQAAYHIHRLGWLVGIIIILQVPYRILCLYYKAILTREESRWILCILAFLILANWGLEMCSALPHSWFQHLGG